MTARRLRRGLAVLVAAAAVAGCGRDGRELADPIFPPPSNEPLSAAELPPATSDQLTDELPGEVAEPTSEPVADASRVVIDRLGSPANATAEVTGAGARRGDPVTVDGVPADLLSFDVAADGTFTIRLWIDDEGAHTVCVADACGRVYTLAPDAETAEEVIAKIEEAIELAADIFPYDEIFPDWSVEVGGALSGTGGTADVERRVVTIYRNRGRSVDDFVRTILHEYGHVVDAVRLDDVDRARYLVLAGYPDDTPWRDPSARRVADWARQPAEDFAEVFVAAWTDGRWLPRTREAPSDELLAATLELSGF